MMYNKMVSFFRKNIEKITLITYVILLPVVSFAEGEVPAPADQGKLVDPLGGKFPLVSDLIQAILQGVLKIGMPVVALAIIYCGFLFVKAQGKPEELKKAKEALTWTLVGAAVLLGAWAIAKMISATVLAL